MCGCQPRWPDSPRSTISGSEKTQFFRGDTVQVTEGELVDLQGVVTSVDGDNVVILPRHDIIKARYTGRTSADSRRPGRHHVPSLGADQVLLGRRLRARH